MTPRQLLLAAAAGGHLVVAALGAASIWLPASAGPVIYAEDAYRAVSGTDKGYGFFAPGVQAPFRIVFDFRDADGTTSTEIFGDGVNGETNLRLASIPSMIPALEPDEQVKVVRSLAADALRRHPRAAEVAVQLEIYGVVKADGLVDFPSMAEFRAGAAPRWLPLDQASFLRPESL